MPCYHPLTGYRSKDLNPSGKRSIVFSPNQGYRDQPVTLPCGQCIGCRLERSRSWAVRCVHEAQMHEKNAFITLTYDDAHLPADKSLCLPDFQKFMKRFRKKCGKKIRFFHCGEYGEQFARPHYHACIFGYDFADKKLWKKSNDFNLYRSELLETLWPFGHSSIGDVTFESAAYVARYITKKITGEAALTHYNQINLQTGEILAERRPEYTTMSKGIGRDWYEKYKTDVYPDDFIVLRGKKLSVPKYYDARYEMEYPSDFSKLKHQRLADAKLAASNCTYDRLAVREEIQLDKIRRLKRSYEND